MTPRCSFLLLTNSSSSYYQILSIAFLSIMHQVLHVLHHLRYNRNLYYYQIRWMWLKSIHYIIIIIIFFLQESSWKPSSDRKCLSQLSLAPPPAYPRSSCSSSELSLSSGCSDFSSGSYTWNDGRSSGKQVRGSLPSSPSLSPSLSPSPSPPLCPPHFPFPSLSSSSPMPPSPSLSRPLFLSLPPSLSLFHHLLHLHGMT